jgi:hypothetical protein
MPAAATATVTASQATRHSRIRPSATAVELIQSNLPAELEAKLQEAFDDE